MSNWKKYRSHFLYTMEHKWYVFLECCKVGMPWRGLVHDLSKFRPKEFIPYALFFFDEDGNRRNPSHTSANDYTALNDEGLKSAWFWHQATNKHHWQFWITPKENGQCFPNRMPDKFIKEMCADMKGAAKAKGTGTALDYYSKNKDNMVLHEDTRTEVEKILGYNRELH